MHFYLVQVEIEQKVYFLAFKHFWFLRRFNLNYLFYVLGESRNGLYGNSTGKRDLYERGHVAACSRGQAVALTVFIFSSIFFTSLAIAFVRPFTLEEAFGKVVSPSYLDHCDSELHPG